MSDLPSSQPHVRILNIAASLKRGIAELVIPDALPFMRKTLPGPWTGRTWRVSSYGHGNPRPYLIASVNRFV